MSKRATLVVILIVLAATLAFAGDVATFANLGFSRDGRRFMFGQYGIDDESTTPYAELYLVDVDANQFVSGGRVSRSFETPAVPGQTGRGGLFNLLTANARLSTENGIDHLAIGRIVYILVNGATPRTEIDFRDFQTGNRYNVRLVQQTRGSGKDASGSFHIQLTATLADGEIKAFTVGLPGFFREAVQSYRIKQIVLSPDEGALVFVMEMELYAESGTDIRYMVETVRIR